MVRAATPRPNIRISLSHYVAPGDHDNLRRIVDWIAARRRILTPAELFELLDRGPDGPRLEEDAHLVTFDDGLMSSYEATRKVLDPLGVKAIFFVPTKILELDDPPEMERFAYERIYRSGRRSGELDEHHYLTMGAGELRALHAAGHMVLPHTHSHALLTEIETQEQVDAELVEPRRALEELLQAPADGFAFPVGTERVVSPFAYEHVRRNYTYCFLGLSGANTEETDRSYIARDCIHPHYSMEHVRNIMEGIYDPYYKLKRRRLRARAA